MIACDEVAAKARREVSQRGDVVAKMRDGAVREVSGERENIRGETVGLFDNSLDEVALDCEAGMYIGYLYDAKTLEVAR